MQLKLLILTIILFIPLCKLAQTGEWYVDTWVPMDSLNPFSKITISYIKGDPYADISFFIPCTKDKEGCLLGKRKADPVNEAGQIHFYTGITNPEKNEFYKLYLKPTGKYDVMMLQSQVANTLTKKVDQLSYFYHREGSKVEVAPVAVAAGIKKEPVEPKRKVKKERESRSKRKKERKPKRTRPSTIPSVKNASLASKVFLPRCRECNMILLLISNHKYQKTIKPIVDEFGQPVCILPPLPPGKYNIKVIWNGKLDIAKRPPYRGMKYVARSGMRTDVTLSRQ
ncbi:MAG: hypothetical protein AAFY71_16220 [Bacteroidota bacterium]